MTPKPPPKRPTPLKRSRTYGKPPKQSPNTRLEIAVPILAALVRGSIYRGDGNRFHFMHRDDAAKAALIYADALMRADRETANAQ